MPPRIVRRTVRGGSRPMKRSQEKPSRTVRRAFPIRGTTTPTPTRRGPIRPAVIATGNTTHTSTRGVIQVPCRGLLTLQGPGKSTRTTRSSGSAGCSCISDTSGTALRGPEEVPRAHPANPGLAAGAGPIQPNGRDAGLLRDRLLPPCSRLPRRGQGRRGRSWSRHAGEVRPPHPPSRRWSKSGASRGRSGSSTRWKASRSKWSANRVAAASPSGVSQSAGSPSTCT